MSSPIHNFLPRSGDPLPYLRRQLTTLEAKIEKLSNKASLDGVDEEKLENLLFDREFVEMLIHGNEEPPHSPHHISLKDVNKKICKQRHQLSKSN